MPDELILWRGWCDLCEEWFDVWGYEVCGCFEPAEEEDLKCPGCEMETGRVEHAESLA